MIKSEYLILVDDSATFCKTTQTFNNIIKSVDGVKIANNRIEYAGLVYEYAVQQGQINHDGNRYFHIKLSIDDDSHIDAFETLARSIRTILTKTSGKPIQVLWEGPSLIYAQRAYPLIHEIENTMRKLITKFMLINIGSKWTNDAIPKEVAESVRNKNAKLEGTYLYEVDFIQLSNFLFKEYANSNLTGLVDKLRKAVKLDDLDLEELKSTIPQSNWDKYFYAFVKCDGDYIKARWEKLYDRRNQVAHNRQINKSEYDEILRLHGELLPKLQEAINGLDQIVVSDTEKETVSENVASTRGDLYMEFLSHWNQIQKFTFTLATVVSAKDPTGLPRTIISNNFRSHLNILTKQYHILEREVRTGLLELFKFRNVIVHHTDVVVFPEHLQERINSLRTYSEILQNKLSRIQSDDFIPSRGPEDATDDDSESGEPDLA